MLSHMKFQIRINIHYIKFFQCVQIEPNSSSLTNGKILQATSVSLFSFAAKKKNENIGNCKAFFVTRKRKKSVKFTWKL